MSPQSDGSGLSGRSETNRLAGWAVVIPVKPATVGKSRLDVPGVDRVALARAIALDTIAAVLSASSVAEVIVVAADGTLRDELSGWPRSRGEEPSVIDRAPAAPDSGGSPSLRAGAPAAARTSTRTRDAEMPRTTDDTARVRPGFAGSPVLAVPAAGLPTRARIVVAAETAPAGLNAAIRTGLEAAGAARPRAVLLGDLPALRPADLDAALALARGTDRGFVPDAEGAGTTLLTARADIPLSPAFGRDSAARHRAAGHADLVVAETSTLRRDVDTAAQLHAALALGLGPRTSALLS
jgi:2-phospho-L-lactate guanylyltransferase